MSKHRVTCKSNEAFEDQLTTGNTYCVIEMKGASYLVANDNGTQRWYGNINFTLA